MSHDVCTFIEYGKTGQYAILPVSAIENTLNPVLNGTTLFE